MVMDQENKIVITNEQLEEFLKARGITVVKEIPEQIAEKEEKPKKAKITEKMENAIKNNSYVKASIASLKKYQQNKLINEETKILEDLQKNDEKKEDLLNTKNIVSAFFKNIGMTLSEVDVENKIQRLEAKELKFNERFGTDVFPVNVDRAINKGVTLRGFAKVTQTAKNNVLLFKELFVKNLKANNVKKIENKIAEVNLKKEEVDKKIENPSNLASLIFNTIKQQQYEAKINNLEDKLNPKEVSEEPNIEESKVDNNESTIESSNSLDAIINNGKKEIEESSANYEQKDVETSNTENNVESSNPLDAIINTGKKEIEESSKNFESFEEMMKKNNEAMLASIKEIVEEEKKKDKIIAEKEQTITELSKEVITLKNVLNNILAKKQEQINNNEIEVKTM
jgi:hypothetical protein